MKYTVIGTMNASIYAKVEAKTPEQAYEKASFYPSLCHQCSDEVELGDVYESVVLNEGGEEVYTDRVDQVSATFVKDWLEGLVAALSAPVADQTKVSEALIKTEALRKYLSSQGSVPTSSDEEE